MKLKVNDYIEINNNSEWIEIQKYLFSLGYCWCNNTTNIIPKCNYPYPDYILIEINHYDYKSLMFSHGHNIYPDSNIIKACKFLRINKLERILNNVY